MTFAFLTFLAVFMLFATGGALLFYREVMIQRISEAIAPRKKQEQKKLTTVIKQTGLSVGQMVGRFEHMLPKSEQEVSVARQRLIRAGYRGENAVKIFRGCKYVVCPLLLCALVAATGLANVGSFFVYVMALGGGFLAPDFWLGKRISARQKKITKGLPDLLDLLVICMEAGLSLDQATARAVQEMPQSQPELCDELGVVVLEQRAGRARSEAWKRMADKNCNLLFPTGGCQPNTHFLEFLKDIAKRASLDPKNFWLHKFRATFATWSLWAGVDLRTVQQWMGHTDMESTMRYLKPNRSQAVRKKVNQVFGEGHHGG